MRIKTLMTTVSLALFFLALPHATHAQKDGEAQAVTFIANDRPILKFGNKDVKKQNCGFFVTYTLMDNQEEAFVVRAAHMHVRRFFRGVLSFPERGWLYITPSRIVFVVEEGDKSHGFDVPRTALTDKPVSRYTTIIAGLQFSLKEKLPASDSDTQKFAFLVFGDRKCNIKDPEPYSKFLERAVKDFNGTMAEFRQAAASLKESGRIEQVWGFVAPRNTGNITGVLTNDIPLPSFPTVSPDSGLESPVEADVNITSEPAGAEIYVDGKLNGSTPSRIPLGVGEHSIKVTRPGYKDWERKITVEQGSVKALNAILEKQ